MSSMRKDISAHEAARLAAEEDKVRAKEAEAANRVLEAEAEAKRVAEEAARDAARTAREEKFRKQRNFEDWAKLRRARSSAHLCQVRAVAAAVPFAPALCALTPPLCAQPAGVDISAPHI